MWPFSRKVRKDAVDFCGEFYDRYVLGPDPIGAKCALAGAISTQQTICKFDESFSEVSLPKLTEELLALRLELIGTAWTHSSTEYAALAISEFTKQHLANIGRSELWEATLDYNHAVAESATFTAGRNTRSGCAMTAFIIQMRANLADDYFARGYDLEAAGRIVNRFGSGPRWNTGIA